MKSKIDFARKLTEFLLSNNDVVSGKYLFEIDKLATIPKIGNKVVYDFEIIYEWVLTKSRCPFTKIKVDTNDIKKLHMEIFDVCANWIIRFYCSNLNDSMDLKLKKNIETEILSNLSINRLQKILKAKNISKISKEMKNQRSVDTSNIDSNIIDKINFNSFDSINDKDVFQILFNFYLSKKKDNCNQSLLNLACCHEEGLGTDKNKTQAKKIYISLSDKGNDYARYKLGLIYEQENNIKKSINYYLDASKQGHEHSLSKILTNHKNTLAKNKDDLLLVRLLHKTSKKGYDSHQYALGSHYLRHAKLIHEYKEKINNYALAMYGEARFWLEQSAKLGNINAKNKLKSIPNFITEIEILTKNNKIKNIKQILSNKKKYAKSIFILYLIFKNRINQDTKSNINKNETAKFEVDCLKESAENGYLKAQFLLGLLYCNSYKYIENDLFEAFKWFKKAAEQNCPLSQFILGTMYNEGKGVEKNYKEAFKWYLKSANNGNASAQNNLASLYEYGLGTDKNLENACKWYLKSANNGLSNAQNSLAYMYKHGIGIEKNLRKSFEWRLKSASQGHDIAQYYLGDMYSNGEGVEKSLSEAFKWFLRSANNGNKQAQYQLYIIYKNGVGVKKDLYESFRWCLRAANNGNPFAQCDLAVLYEDGLGTSKNLKEAFRWYLASSKQGNGCAQMKLAMMYYHGNGIELDYKLAYKWLLESAKKGYSYAQYNLGLMHYSGKGVNKNYKNAFEWFLKASNNGHALAQNNLANMYLTGDGVERNSKEAYKWFSKSSNNGCFIGMNNLGLLYKKGDGVGKDLCQAFKLFQKVAINGLDSGQNNLAIMYANGEGVDQNHKEALKWFLKSANQGYIPAQNNLGAFYENGLGKPKDLKEAFKWYLKSANNGSSSAQYKVSLMYENGDGTDKNIMLAFDYCSKAAHSKDDKALYRLAVMYNNGIGTNKDTEKAYNYFLESSKLGNKDAILWIEQHDNNKKSNVKLSYF